MKVVRWRRRNIGKKIEDRRWMTDDDEALMEANKK